MRSNICVFAQRAEQCCNQTELRAQHKFQYEYWVKMKLVTLPGRFMYVLNWTVPQRNSVFVAPFFLSISFFTHFAPYMTRSVMKLNKQLTIYSWRYIFSILTNRKSGDGMRPQNDKKRIEWTTIFLPLLLLSTWHQTKRKALYCRVISI